LITHQIRQEIFISIARRTLFGFWHNSLLFMVISLVGGGFFLAMIRGVEWGIIPALHP
jgi:hypothetical protein